MGLTSVGFYAAILGLMYIALAFRIIKLRYKYKTGIGDGGHAELAQAIRVHGNFAEYTPLALILLALAAYSGSHPILVHACGAAFTIGRVLHAIAITHSKGPSKFRFWGMISSFIVIAILSVENIRLFLTAML